MKLEDLILNKYVSLVEKGLVMVFHLKKKSVLTLEDLSMLSVERE